MVLFHYRVVWRKLSRWFYRLYDPFSGDDLKVTAPTKEKKEEISETLTYREAVSRKVSGMIQEVVSHYPSLKAALSVKLRWQGRKAFWGTYESSRLFTRFAAL